MKLYQCKGRLKVVNMKKEMQNYTQNRELSWLKFNQRVLEEAKDSSVPLLERMKFVSIFTSNLDEFFMIRVGSLYDMSLTDNSTIDSRSGMNPKEQLDAIFAAVAPLYKERDKTYSEIKKLAESIRCLWTIDKRTGAAGKEVCEKVLQRPDSSDPVSTDRGCQSSVSTSAQ